ncbi:iron ABC transporter permease [Microbacterium sp. RURRCA19A]|uniref:FecCD family ABC transporter permease n=1 Tax=Microbacterium sp. RURRCA19A TaxID=1907391 RepID=UPI0009565455|nr:iron ABC transporter permease [Microbacterium sp. RURRCA19A]SIS02076.1 iron complex transport system permease protein [Microbacterium sp. RURRCA19A]
MTAVATAPAAAPPARVRVARRVPVVFAALAVALVALVIVSAGSGQLSIPPDQVLGAFARAWNDAVRSVGLGFLSVAPGTPVAHVNGEATLWLIRMPRLLMAVLVGAALAVAGVVMQGVFRNPLAEPGVIGISSGAAVGASASIVFGLTFLGPLTLPVLAFAGGLAAIAVVYASARADGRTEVVTLVLTGIAVNAVGGAAIALFTYLGSTQQREQIVFWQLGSLNGTRWDDLAVVAPLAVVGIVACLFFAGSLDLLALGERQAEHLGVRVERLRVVAIVVIALLTCAAVAFCGIIGFVGLVVPHLMRMVLGPGHRLLLPASALGGAVLLVAADLVARTIVPGSELPIGMLTALIGGPFFFWLLRRTRRRSGGWG